MAPPKFTDTELRAFLDAGHTQADAARHFGVSEPAIHQRLKRMKAFTSHVVALEKAGEVVEEKLSATARLERIQQVIDEELAWAVTQARQEGADRAALVDTILRLSGEVRHQLGLQLDISRTLVDLRVLKEFHETVVDAIREESPETARRIVARLKERRALRPSADLPSLTGGRPYGVMA
jgi:predicted RNA polymerase sigma factor